MERTRRRSGRLSRAYPSHQVGGEARHAGGVALSRARRPLILLCLLARGRRQGCPWWAGPAREHRIDSLSLSSFLFLFYFLSGI